MLRNKTVQLKNLFNDLKNIQSELSNVDNELIAITDSLEESLHSSQSPHLFKQQKKEMPDLASVNSRIDRFIKKIEKKLFMEVLSIETEMHGVQIYSDYEQKKIKHCAEQKKLKDVLLQISELIGSAKIEKSLGKKSR
ncbi:MAG: hypothetical protein JO149_03800 [Gammaproteobacteria bacterium]|nr:hypothetical protein [Gammaproteobacteria bacterium]